MNGMDEARVIAFLNTAVIHGNDGNEFGEAYWLGRAIEYANQNAVDTDWLTEQMRTRELDEALVAVPKPGEAEARQN